MTSSNCLLDSIVILVPLKDCDLMLGVCAMSGDYEKYVCFCASGLAGNFESEGPTYS